MATQTPRQKSKATATPWHARRKTGSHEDRFTIEANGMGMRIVDTVPGIRHIEEDAANAELIVRAVNSYDTMLEALKGIESTYVFLDSLTAGLEPQHKNTVKALNRIRYAIRLAEGRTEP